MDIAKRMGEINDSPIRKFYGLANEAEKNGKKIYYLNIGQPDIQTPSEFFKAVKGFNQSVLAYAPARSSLPSERLRRASNPSRTPSESGVGLRVRCVSFNLKRLCRFPNLVPYRYHRFGFAFCSILFLRRTKSR